MNKETKEILWILFFVFLAIGSFWINKIIKHPYIYTIIILIFILIFIILSKINNNKKHKPLLRD